MNNFIIELNNVTKIYNLGEVQVKALRGISFKVKKGDFVALMGPSGSGKSTCLNIIGCLDRPTSGSYIFEGDVVNKLNDTQLAHIRNKKIGFVFQSFNLLPRSTALENVELPLLYGGVGNRKAKAKNALEAVGLGGRFYHRPTELSGGEQQRVAIARAIVNEPELILADEPTGNLDSRSGEEIMKIFDMLNAQGITIILVTHNRDISVHAGYVINFKDGRILATA